MARPIKACYIQDDKYILYPKTYDFIVVDENDVSIKEKIDNITQTLEYVVEYGCGADLSQFATIDYVDGEIVSKIDELVTPENVLGITTDDIGKILSVAQGEDGSVVTKAFDITEFIKPESITYNNENFTELTNISDAVDYLLTESAKPISWDAIEDKPEIAEEQDVEEIIQKL